MPRCSSGQGGAKPGHPCLPCRDSIRLDLFRDLQDGIASGERMAGVVRDVLCVLPAQVALQEMHTC